MDSTSTRVTRSQSRLNDSGSSVDSSGTEEYEVPVLQDSGNRGNQNDEIIEINDTQMPLDDDNDDVVLIQPEIETIDLCTPRIPLPANMQNAVIDITDSPAPTRRNNTANTRSASSRLRTSPGPTRARRNNNRTSPYNTGPSNQNSPPAAAPTAAPSSATANLDESLSSQSSIHYNCPICLESVKNREPVTTICGHVFCKPCIRMAIQGNRKCPMCKKTLNARTPFFPIYL